MAQIIHGDGLLALGNESTVPALWLVSLTVFWWDRAIMATGKWYKLSFLVTC